MVIAVGFPSNENFLAEMQKKTLRCSEKHGCKQSL